MKAIKLISILAAVLVAILALMAFVLSYSSLQHLAELHQVGPRLSYAWPLLLDFAMVVFSLAILRANLRQEPAWYPWGLTIAFATLATLANVLDVATLGIPPMAIAASVKALAPVALVLAFELLMGMIKAEIKRAGVVISLAELRQDQDKARAELDKLARQIQAKRAELDRTESASVVTNAANVTDNLSLLDKANEAKQDKVSERRANVLAMLQDGLSPDDISGRLAVSVRTVKRDIVSLNGQARTL